MDNLYYVGTEDNVADIGTRADKVTLSDIGPESRYENGDAWMRMDLAEAVTSGFLTLTSKLKAVATEEDVEFKKGFMFEKEPEILTRGHTTLLTENLSCQRISKMEERALFSKYGLLLPTRRSFPSMVRITAYVIAFVTKCKLKAMSKTMQFIPWSGPLLKESSLWFSAFPVVIENEEQQAPWVNSSSISPSQDHELVEAFSSELKPVDLAFFMETHTVTMPGN